MLRRAIVLPAASTIIENIETDNVICFLPSRPFFSLLFPISLAFLNWESECCGFLRPRNEGNGSAYPYG